MAENIFIKLIILFENNGTFLFCNGSNILTICLRGTIMRYKSILLALVLFLLLTACSNEEKYEYEFPVSRIDMEKVLEEQKLNWSIKEISVSEEAQKNIITLTNNDNIIFALGFKVDEGRKVLNITWLLPKEFTPDKINEFYNKELPELFDLVGIFYGNKKEMDKGLSEFLNYYLDNESNYEDGVYWTKRIGEHHLKGEIKTYGPYNDDLNRLGLLLVMPDESYENYLRVRNESWKEIDETNLEIEMKESTVSEMSEIKYPDDEEMAAKIYIVRGHLENIKEIKTVPESLINIHATFTVPNKDKYLSAKLVDDTGSISVFVQTTSLSKNELKMEREHQVIMTYYENSPVLIVINSALTD